MCYQSALYKAVLLLISIVSVSNAVQAEQLVSTLDEALERVSKYNPLLRSSPYRIRSAESAVAQAGRLPNPELQLEVENFAGDADDFDMSETSVAISQPIELGGKRTARTSLATSEKDILAQKTTANALRIFAETKLAYTNLVYSQGLVRLAEEQVSLSEAVVTEVQRKHEAGAVLQVEKTKADIALQSLRLTLQQAMAELEISRQNLASLWGGGATEVGTPGGALHTEGAKDFLREFDVSKCPEAILAELKRDAAKKKHSLERAQAVPDVSIGLGYRRLEETETDTFLGTFSVELPFFDRNSDAISETEQQIQVAALDQEGTLQALERRLKNLQSQLRSLLTQESRISDAIIPASNNAFQQSREAYRVGTVSYLELLDAQRSLFEAKKTKQNILRSLTFTIIKLEALLGSDQGQV